jgi:hypothetical protein
LLHDAFLDYPLIAMVALTFALLIRAGNFQDRRDAILFGFVFALGFLTKQTFLMFLGLPMLYVTIRVALSRNFRAIENLALAALTVIVVAGIWYGPHLDDVIEIYQANKIAAVNENEAPLFSYRSNLFYPHALLSTQMQLPLALLFVVGLIYSLFRKRKESILLYLWLISGIGAFTLIANKDPRYTVPVLPAAALLSVSWLVSRLRAQSPSDRRSLPIRLGLTAKTARISVLIAAGCWGLVSFFNAQWPRPGVGTYIDTPDFRWMVFARNYFTLDHRPNSDDWSIPAIVTAIRDEGERLARNDQPVPGTNSIPRTSPSTGPYWKSGQPITVGVTVNLPYLNPSTVALYARLLNSGRGDPPMFVVDWLVVPSAGDRLEHCDFLVVRDGLDRAEWLAPLERSVEQFIQNNPNRFAKVAEFPIPIEGSQAVLYRAEGRSATNDSVQK